jgi:hypothetical protein
VGHVGTINPRRETMSTKSTTSAIRQALRQRFGSHQYRITAVGAIHARGTMPNTNAFGWYLYGRIDSAETLARLGIEQ